MLLFSEYPDKSHKLTPYSHHISFLTISPHLQLISSTPWPRSVRSRASCYIGITIGMIITFMGDTDYVFSEILWSSCFDCSIKTKLKFSFLSPLAYSLKQAWKSHWPRKSQYRVMNRKTISADLHVSYKGRITVCNHLEDLLDTPVYHSQIFARKRFIRTQLQTQIALGSSMYASVH